jgi:HK97 family phage portal protein
MIASNEHRILWLPGDDESRAWDDEAPTRRRSPKITPDNAHMVSDVFSVIRVRAETVASLPLHVYERTAKGGKRLARELPLYRQLHTQPNGWQTSYEWREQMVYHLDLWGSGFSELLPGRIEPLHPSRMSKVDRLETGRLMYHYRGDDWVPKPISQDKILHFRGPSDDGVNGWQIPVECRDAIELARGCEVHGVRYFSNGARPGFVLSTDGQMNPEARESIRGQWNRRHGGVENAHETAVLTGGLKPVAIPQSSNTDSQFLEQRLYQLRQIARLYRVPGYLLGLEQGTPQAEIEFVTHVMIPLLRRLEMAMMRDLLGGDDRYVIEFDVRGLLRGDSASRAAYNRAMWDIGVVSTNEIRVSENMDPVEGGDERYRPLNMGALGAPPTPEDVLAQQKKGSGIDGQGVEGGLAAATDAASAPPADGSAPADEPQVADLSLNGAQITSLITILSQIPAGLITKDAAAALISASFPSINSAQVQAILAGVSETAIPAPPAPPPASPKPEGATP